jgi:hypothetical protein
MNVSRDELEYAISQYIDGDLPATDRAALEERLASDAEVRAILSEYQNLDSMLAMSLPAPDVDFNALKKSIAGTIAGMDSPASASVFGRIGWTARLAISASILLLMSAAMLVFRTGSNPQNPGLVKSPDHLIDPGVALVSGPAAQQSTGQVIDQVQIGPSPAMAGNWRVAEELVTRPTVVVIDRAPEDAHDGDMY